MNRASVWEIVRTPWLFDSRTLTKCCPHLRPSQTGWASWTWDPAALWTSWWATVQVLKFSIVFEQGALRFPCAPGLTYYAADPICKGPHWSPPAPSSLCWQEEACRRLPVAGGFDGAEGWEPLCHPLAGRGTNPEVPQHSDEYFLWKKQQGTLMFEPYEKGLGTSGWFLP